MRRRKKSQAARIGDLVRTDCAAFPRAWLFLFSALALSVCGSVIGRPGGRARPAHIDDSFAVKSRPSIEGFFIVQGKEKGFRPRGWEAGRNGLTVALRGFMSPSGGGTARLIAPGKGSQRVT